MRVCTKTAAARYSRPTVARDRLYKRSSAVDRFCHEHAPLPRVLCRTSSCSNIVRRRPPDNRTPTAEELEFYVPMLLEEIRLVDPDVIVTLGTSNFYSRGCTGKGGVVTGSYLVGAI